LTNSFFDDKVEFIMFLHRLVLNKRDRRNRIKRVDQVSEQVRKVLTDVDQKLILMVRS